MGLNPGPDDAAGRLPGRLAVGFAGLLHLLVGSFVLASGRVLPTPAAIALAGLWLLAAVLGWRWRHRRPLVVLLLPFVVAAAWWATALAVRGA